MIYAQKSDFSIKVGYISPIALLPLFLSPISELDNKFRN